MAGTVAEGARQRDNPLVAHFLHRVRNKAANLLCISCRASKMAV
jgi:hypothetical protein